MSSPSSVGVKSDMVEMLSVGEETAVFGILANLSEGYSTSCKMEGGTIPRKMTSVAVGFLVSSSSLRCNHAA